MRQSQDDARALLAEADRLSDRIEEHAAELAAYGGDHQRLSAFSDMASDVSNRISAHIDKELTSLQLAAQMAQQKSVPDIRCCWSP